MTTKLTLIKRAALLVLLSTLNLQRAMLFAQGTAFTYQGKLNENGSPANGSYDLRFKLFVDPLGNTQAGSAVAANGVSVANGLFTVTVDFGAGVFNGSNYWLEVDVKTNGGGAYVNLNPLQAVTPTPYAVFAETAGNGGFAAGMYTNAVTLNNAANSFNGSFAGNGAGVSNVNALTLNGQAAGGFWQLGGNNVAGGQFLGSTNNRPVEIWANGTRTLRLEPNTNGAPNVIGGAPVNFVDPGIVGATIAGGGTVSGNFYLGAGSNHVAAIFGTIAGGRMHTVAADHAFIGGGIGNTIELYAYDSVIGGGVRNLIQTNAAESVLCGGIFNTIQPSASYSFIGGGSGNTIQTNSYYSTLAGGNNNFIQTGNTYSFLGGGSGNSLQPNASVCFLGGGAANSIQAGASYSVLDGGYFNFIQANAAYSFLGGGYNNSIQTNAAYSFLGGGTGNSIQTNASYSFLGGGTGNSIQTNASYSFVGGGRNNSIQTNATYASIAGGSFNVIQTNAAYASIGGGTFNVNGGSSAVVAGGNGNVNSGALSGIGGGFLNRNSAQYGTIAGGSANTNAGYGASIGGGQQNLNSGYSAAVGGGFGNVATNQAATIAGGQQNLSGGFDATVGGGANNSAIGDYSTVGGGNTNRATGSYATVSGGRQNISSGYAATIPGGSGNMASGFYSFAAGNGAQAVNDGSFVWADNTAGTFSSTANNQFSVRAAGGILLAADIQIEGGTAYHHLQFSGGNALGYLYGSYPNPSLGDGIHLGYNWYSDAAGVGHVNNIGGGTSRISAGYGEIILAVGGVNSTPTIVRLDATTAGVTVYGTFNNFSDRNAKQDFAPVSPSQILDKVAQLPVSEWSYKEDPATRHLGPMAQDFYAAFNIGTDDKHIAPMDEGGVALAAIQGLNLKLEERENTIRSELKQKQTEIAALKRQLEELKQMVDKLSNARD